MYPPLLISQLIGFLFCYTGESADLRMPSEELSNLVLGLRLETDFDDNGSLRHTVARDETLEPRSEIVECWVPDQFPASGQRGRHSAVRLEQRDTDKSQKRVVKEVGKFSDGQLRVDYVRELEALALLAGSEVSTTIADAMPTMTW